MKKLAGAICALSILTFFSGCAQGNSGESVAVTGIKINGDKTVEAGKTLTLTATVSPDDATDKTVTWSMLSGSEFASVDNGTVTGIAAGAAVVKAAAGNYWTKYTITVTAASTTNTGTSTTGGTTDATVAVTGVTISGETSVTVGNSITLTAAVVPTNATNKTVTWAVTSGDTFASVSSSGQVTGLSAGSAVITATAGGKAATTTITVNAAAGGGSAVTGTNGTIMISNKTGTSFTVSYTPATAITSCAAFISVGNGTGLALANQAMTLSGSTWSFTATDPSYKTGVKIFIQLYTSAGITIPQGDYGSAACNNWASFTY